MLKPSWMGEAPVCALGAGPVPRAADSVPLGLLPTDRPR